MDRWQSLTRLRIIQQPILLTNAAGCDSTVTLDLTINNSTVGTDVKTACESFTWIDGNTYTSSNNTATHLLTNAAGCDSTVTLDLTITNSSSFTETVTACDSLQWNGSTYFTSGNQTFTTANAAGCDSVVDLVLTINNSGSSFLATSSCNSYDWNGTTYSTSGIYVDTLVNSSGCTQIDTLDLTISNSIVSAGLDDTICAGDFVTLNGSGAGTYAWDNNVTDGIAFNPSQTTTYTVTGTDSNGCFGTDDVLVTVNALPTVNAGLDVAICPGDSVQLNGGGGVTNNWINYNNGDFVSPINNTVYTVIGIDDNGCTATDSIEIFVNPIYYNVSIISLCTGDSIFAGGAYQKVSGTFYDTLSSINGCDSIITTTLTISPVITNSVSASICSGDSLFVVVLTNLLQEFM